MGERPGDEMDPVAAEQQDAALRITQQCADSAAIERDFDRGEAADCAGGELTCLGFAAKANIAAEAEPAGAHSEAAALGIPGLWLLRDFVDAEEEAALLAHADADDARWQRLARRRVLHEGFRFDYAVRQPGC
jgi:hypothetical protein